MDSASLRAVAQGVVQQIGKEADKLAVIAGDYRR
jgi:hypothetical protein